MAITNGLQTGVFNFSFNFTPIPKARTLSAIPKYGEEHNSLIFLRLLTVDFLVSCFSSNGVSISRSMQSLQM